MNRILLEPGEIDGDGIARLSDERARHIISVLKPARGNQLQVGIINGPAGKGTVKRLTNNAVYLECSLDERPPLTEQLDLLLALPRPKVLRRLLPQIAALGVRRIFLTNAWRVEKNYFGTHVLEAEVLRKLLIEGIQQAGTTLLPEVSVHRHLRKLVEDDMPQLLPASTERLLAHPAAKDRLVRRPLSGSNERVVLAVGPEGGWIDPELVLFAKCGFRAVGLGTRILRSDTACIAMLAVTREQRQL